jgi:DNA-binding transcriptional LysR family regulator
LEVLARGVPEHPDDLVHHDCVGIRQQNSGQLMRWPFRVGTRVIEIVPHPAIIVDVSDGVAAVLVAGGGIGVSASHLYRGVLCCAWRVGADPNAVRGRTLRDHCLVAEKPACQPERQGFSGIPDGDIPSVTPLGRTLQLGQPVSVTRIGSFCCGSFQPVKVIDICNLN